MKRYVQTIKVNKKDENENDSDADGGGGDDETEITKSYTWDVDRTWDQQTHRPKNVVQSGRSNTCFLGQESILSILSKNKQTCPTKSAI